MGGCPTYYFIGATTRKPSGVSTAPLGGTIETDAAPPVVVTGDARFCGRFTDDLESSTPIRVFTVDDQRAVNVTRDYPLHVEADASKQWKYFGESSSGLFRGRGFLAAWAADECSLGRQQDAW
jgi:hypothetical protein